MSTDQGQRAEFRFNKTNFAKISKKVRENINAYHQYCFDVAIVIYNELKTNKVKKDYNIAFNFIKNKMHSTRSVGYFGYKEDFYSGHNLTGYRNIKNDFKFSIKDYILHLALDEIFRNKNKTLLKPRRIAYPHIKNTEKSFGVTFEDDQVEIFINADSLSAIWNIETNNHNVDHYGDEFYGRLLFSVINSHKWGRNETGTLITKVENFDDSYDADRYNYDYVYYGDAKKNQSSKYNR